MDGFWSVTVYDADCGVTLTVSQAQPADTSNWLRAPAGPCHLVMRNYMQREKLRSWTILAQQRLTA